MDGANGIDNFGKFTQSASRPLRRERYKSLIQRAKKANDSNAFILPSIADEESRPAPSLRYDRGRGANKCVNVDLTVANRTGFRG
jgi:hypothetical protein